MVEIKQQLKYIPSVDLTVVKDEQYEMTRANLFDSVAFS